MHQVTGQVTLRLYSLFGSVSGRLIRQTGHRVPAIAIAREFDVPVSSVVPWGVPGGQGEVWRVSHARGIDAVKIFTVPAEPHRIPAEVEALSRVLHPNVVRFVGQSAIRVGADSYKYIRYEFIDGQSLDEALHVHRPTPSQLRALGRGILSGLVALHASSVVHRDLKPMNIVLRSNQWGQPVIIDFGLVRLIDQSTKTVYPWAHGTWPWMSPEQFAGERAFQRADVFASAIIIYQAGLGRHPFLALNELGPYPPPNYAQRFGQPIPLTGLSNGVAGVITRCLQPLAVRRPSAAQALDAWNRLP